MSNTKTQSVGTIATIAISLYVAFQIFSDILSTKIGLLPIINLAVDGGTIIYPLTFTVRDFVHKTLGKEMARKVVVLAASLNVVMVILFWIVGQMPQDEYWGLQDSYEAILMPVWRITLASIVAEVFSELIDTEVFSRAYKRWNDVIAVLASNFIALIIDSLIFCILAFYGQLPTKTVLEIILVNILVKGIMSLVSAPVIRLIPREAELKEI